jgi:pimeloyl-ACP methyl ester carboxylesterase
MPPSSKRPASGEQYLTDRAAERTRTHTTSGGDASVSPITPEPRVVETDDALITYREIGSGDQTLVCLHGGGPGASGWGNFGFNAQDLASRYRVIVPDHPGFGASRITHDRGETYKTLAARAVVGLMDALDIERASLLGNSMGGGVALTVALRDPERVDRLVLMGPWVHGAVLRVYSPKPSTLLSSYYPEPSLEKMRELISAMVYDSDFPGAEDLARSRYEVSLQEEIRAGYVRMNSGMGEDLPGTVPVNFETLATIEHEVLLLWGRDDRFCSLDEAFMYLELLRNANLMLFRDTGHWVQIERRTEFAAHVSAFLGLGGDQP